mgnify:CR=1 FL=1
MTGDHRPPPLGVRDVVHGDLDLIHGGSVVLLGPSGAGKTRWLRRMLGFGGRPDELLVAGEPADVREVRAAVAWVPETDGVFLDQTIAANVGAQHAGPTVDPSVAGAMVDLVGLADRRDDPASVLTRNERRRVALARGLALQRPVLVVDGALDPQAASRLPLWLVQIPWIDAVLSTSTVIDADVEAAPCVALVDDDRIIARGPLDVLRSSDLADVKTVLAWVTP